MSPFLVGHATHPDWRMALSLAAAQIDAARAASPDGGTPTLGIAYFTVVVTLIGVSLGLIVSPLSLVFPAWEVMGYADGWSVTHDAPWLLPLLAVAGVLLLFATLHLARLVGHFHGWLAKQLLVRDPVV